MEQSEFEAYVGSLESRETTVNPTVLRSIHASIGIAGEAGEILDQVKRVLVYGASFDRVHLIEEMGDLFHYLTMLMNIHAITLDEVRNANVRKLAVRYPGNVFTPKRATTRNRSAERAAMEDTT